MPSTRSRTRQSPNSELPQPTREWLFTAIGTRWWIGLYEPVFAEQFQEVQSRIVDLTETFDARYSRFRTDSLVSTWARQAATFPMPPDALALLNFYRKLYSITDGAVTPLVGQLLSDAGYDAHYSLKPRRTVRPPKWADTLRYSDTDITLLQPALLDFGAAGKGYLVDQICQLLDEQGIHNYLVDGSGDMRCSFDYSTKLAIGLENPVNTKQVIGVAQLGSGALCGSAGNRRVWGEGKHRYTHIMSPFTRESPRHIQSAWVTARTAMQADGLTTALYFTEPERLRQVFDFEYVCLMADGTLDVSKDFPATFFVRETA